MTISPETFGIDEETPLRERYWKPQDGDVVIDIGCFHGSYTLPALAAGACVYAIDARIEPLEVLWSRAEEFGLADHLITIHAAVSAGGPYSADHIAAIANGPAPSREMIPDADWWTLDEIAIEYKLERADWIKIDVEGGECGVLDGGREMLGMYEPTLLIEDHSRVYPWVAEQQVTGWLLGFLAALGYETKYISDTYPDYVVAWRP